MKKVSAKSVKIISWIFAIIAAVIMLQTLFFKFTAATESVYIFTTLGIEPWGRIGSGIVEFIASTLLLIPLYRWLGALLGIGVMMGAIISHLTLLGIEVQNDGGYLFFLALFVFISSSICLYFEKDRLKHLYSRIAHSQKK